MLLPAPHHWQPHGNQGGQIQCTPDSASFPVAAHQSTNPIWDNEKAARQPAIGQRQHLNSQWHLPPRPSDGIQ